MKRLNHVQKTAADFFNEMRDAADGISFVYICLACNNDFNLTDHELDLPYPCCPFCKSENYKTK